MEDIEDQIYKTMCEVIHMRKTYPALLMELEEKRISAEIEAYSNIKVELSEDSRKELKLIQSIAEDTKKLASKVPAHSVTSEAEQSLIKKQQNMKDITEFMKFRAECQNSNANADHL